MQTMFITIKDVTILTIIGQVILHFAPLKYEKYLKPILALIILLQICIGLLSVFQHDIRETVEKEISAYGKAFSTYDDSMEEMMQQYQYSNILNENLIKDDSGKKENSKNQEETKAEGNRIGEITVKRIQLTGG